jgi:hypothetical protein
VTSHNNQEAAPEEAARPEIREGSESVAAPASRELLAASTSSTGDQVEVLGVWTSGDQAEDQLRYAGLDAACWQAEAVPGPHGDRVWIARLRDKGGDPR